MAQTRASSSVISAVPDDELAAAVRLCQELRRDPPPASPLWARNRPQPPLPEAAVSALRRCARLDALHLGGLAPAPEPVIMNTPTMRGLFKV